MIRLILLALLIAAPAASAQPLDLSSGGPLEITARGGFEWHDTEQLVIASGDARAVRGNVTVLADKLVARIRKKAVTGDAKPAAANIASSTANGTDAETGGNEVYRLEAHGNVRILTTTDEAIGDDATYDIDQAVMILTGAHLKLTTPHQVLTARDTMEYWSDKRMAVGRGNAVVITDDGRRLAGDVLVSYITDPNAPVAGAPAAKPASPTPAKASTDPLTDSGKIQRIEAFGNVEVRTAIDTVRGDRGVYVPDTGIAIVEGNTRITHNNQQFNGAAADINMKTGIARLRSGPAERVRGVIVPNDVAADTKAPAAAKPGKTIP